MDGREVTTHRSPASIHQSLVEVAYLAQPLVRMAYMKLATNTVRVARHCQISKAKYAGAGSGSAGRVSSRSIPAEFPLVLFRNSQESPGVGLSPPQLRVFPIRIIRGTGEAAQVTGGRILVTIPVLATLVLKHRTVVVLSTQLARFMTLSKKLIVLVVFINAQLGGAQPTNLDGFVEALDVVLTTKPRILVSDLDLTGAKMTASKGFGSEATWVPILELWLAGDQDFLELLWWRSSDRQTRMFVATLIWCQRPPPPPEGNLRPEGILYFRDYAGRFGDVERDRRLGELDFVEKHLSALASRILMVCKGIDSAWSKALAIRYQAVVEQKLGQPLLRKSETMGPHLNK